MHHQGMHFLGMTFSIKDLTISPSLLLMHEFSLMLSCFNRTFKPTDVPSSVSKIAPEYCSVYVVYKGKLSSSRPSTRAKPHYCSWPPNDSEIAGDQFHTSKSSCILSFNLLHYIQVHSVQLLFLVLSRH